MIVSYAFIVDFYSILFLTNFIFINLICLENGNVPIEGFFLYIFGLYQFFIMVLVGYTYNGFIYDLTILMLFYRSHRGRLASAYW